MNENTTSEWHHVPALDIRASFSLVNTLNEHKKDGYETEYILHLMCFCLWNEPELSDLRERWNEDSRHDLDMSDPAACLQYATDQTRIFEMVWQKRDQYYIDWLTSKGL